MSESYDFSLQSAWNFFLKVKFSLTPDGAGTVHGTQCRSREGAISAEGGVIETDKGWGPGDFRVLKVVKTNPLSQTETDRTV